MNRRTLLSRLRRLTCKAFGHDPVIGRDAMAALMAHGQADVPCGACGEAVRLVVGLPNSRWQRATSKVDDHAPMRYEDGRPVGLLLPYDPTPPDAGVDTRTRRPLRGAHR